MKQLEGGRVIAFDGPDGVGKSTQIELLEDYLTAQGHKVHTTRSSGGTQFGEELRKASLSPLPRPAESDLHVSMAMNIALSEELPRHREIGEIVLIDRSPLAIIAYNGYGSQLSNKEMAFEAAKDMLDRWTLDALVVFNASPETLEEKRQKAGKSDWYEKQGADYHARVRDGYEAGLEYVGKHTSVPLIEIDASGSVEEIHESVKKSLGF